MIVCSETDCPTCKYDGPIEDIVVEWYPASEPGEIPGIGASYPCFVRGKKDTCTDCVDHRDDEIQAILKNYKLDDYLIPIDGPKTIRELLMMMYDVVLLERLTYKTAWTYTPSTQCRSCGIVNNISPGPKQCPKCGKDMKPVFVKNYKKSGYVKKRGKKK